ncbi:MAG: hypothetical protein QM482_07765 [Sulfurospirillum sp.]
MKYIVLTVLLFFTSCSYKHDSLYISSKKTTEQSVANTKKTQILKNGKVKIFVTVTYLNSLKNQKIIDKKKEQFIVGFYFVNFGTKEINKVLNLKDVKFSIEDETHLISVKKLKPSSPILQIIPASNPWSQYFLVQTPKISKNSITFSLKVDSYKKAVLKFEKNY